MYGKLATTLSSALRVARERREHSVEEIAWILGIDEDAYLRIEGGVELPSVLVLYMLCDVLRVSPEDLLGMRPLEATPPPTLLH